MQHMTRFNAWMNSITLAPDSRTDWNAMPPEFVGRMLDCAQNPACAQAPSQIGDLAAMQGQAFDSVFAGPGAEAIRERLLVRGYRETTPGGPLRPVGHQLVVRGLTAYVQAPAFVQLVWPDTLGPLGQLGVDPSTASADLPLGPLPAGPAELRVLNAADGAPLLVLPLTIEADAAQTVVTLPPTAP